jgi:hypothetical protein
MTTPPPSSGWINHEAEVTEADWAAHAARVRERIERAYRVRVVTRDLPAPWTGDLDGAEIVVHAGLGAEERLFLLAHLFGHTVQWNTQPGACELGQLQVPPVAEDRLAAILAYEREAAGYGAALLGEAGVTGLEQWLADYSACDADYLRHYYRTGERQAFRSFWRGAAPLLTPLPIPTFAPLRRRWRRGGLVL